MSTIIKFNLFRTLVVLFVAIGVMVLSGCAGLNCDYGYEERQVPKFVCDYETYSSGGVVQTRQTNCRTEYVSQSVCKGPSRRANVPAGDDGYGFRYEDIDFSAEQEKAARYLNLHEFKGEYKCTQGKTLATLKLNRSDGEKIRGLFSFDAPGPQKRVRGSYKVELHIYKTHMRRDVTNPAYKSVMHHYASMRPIEWVDQPAGYVMLEASSLTYYRRTKALTGKLDTAGCGSISLE